MSQGEKLALLRKQKGLTQQELAEAVEVSRQTVSRWETGEAAPAEENLERLCGLYGVTRSELLGGEPMSPPPAPEPTARERGGKGSAWRRLWIGVMALALVLAFLGGFWLGSRNGRVTRKDRIGDLKQDVLDPEDDDGIFEIEGVGT